MNNINRNLGYTKNLYPNKERIKVGDVIRISEPDKYGGSEYAIFTYLDEFKSYFWLSEYIIYNYCTLNVSKSDMKIFLQKQILELKKRLPEIKKIGHITEEVTQKKLAPEWLVYYDALFYYSKNTSWNMTIGEAAIKSFALKVSLKEKLKESYDEIIKTYKDLILKCMNNEACSIIEAAKMIVDNYEGDSGKEFLKMYIIVAMAEMYQEKAKEQ